MDVLSDMATAIFAAASAFAVPAELIAQTTVPSPRLTAPGQWSFEAGLDDYSLDGATDNNLSVPQDSVTSAAPACIASCLPWINLNQRF